MALSTADSDQILAANDRYASSFTNDGLPLPRARRTAVVTCMDARLDPAKFLGLEEGDALPPHLPVLGAGAGRACGLPDVRELEIRLIQALEEQDRDRFSAQLQDRSIGARAGRFQTELVEAAPTEPDAGIPSFLARLWKLHGSVNWLWEEGGRSEIVRLGTPVKEGQAAAIYPSDTKYEESRRVPFVVLQDRLRRALNQPETPSGMQPRTLVRRPDRAARARAPPPSARSTGGAGSQP